MVRPGNPLLTEWHYHRTSRRNTQILIRFCLRPLQHPHLNPFTPAQQRPPNSTDERQPLGVTMNSTWVRRQSGRLPRTEQWRSPEAGVRDRLDPLRPRRESESPSVMSSSLQPHGLYSAWNCPGQNTGVGSLSLLQGIFPTQGSNPGLPPCRWILYQLSHKGSPRILEWVAFPFFRGSSQPRDQTGVSWIAGGFFTRWATREAQEYWSG